MSHRAHLLTAPELTPLCFGGRLLVQQYVAEYSGWSNASVRVAVRQEWKISCVAHNHDHLKELDIGAHSEVGFLRSDARYSARSRGKTQPIAGKSSPWCFAFRLSLPLTFDYVAEAAVIFNFC